MKELINQAYEIGMKAYPGPSAPCLSAEFMAILPSEYINTDKLRIKMYKAFIKGWTISNLGDEI